MLNSSIKNILSRSKDNWDDDYIHDETFTGYFIGNIFYGALERGVTEIKFENTRHLVDSMEYSKVYFKENNEWALAAEPPSNSFDLAVTFMLQNRVQSHNNIYPRLERWSFKMLPGAGRESGYSQDSVKAYCSNYA